MTVLSSTRRSKHPGILPYRLPCLYSEQRPSRWCNRSSTLRPSSYAGHLIAFSIASSLYCHDHVVVLAACNHVPPGSPYVLLRVASPLYNMHRVGGGILEATILPVLLRVGVGSPAMPHKNTMRLDNPFRAAKMIGRGRDWSSDNGTCEVLARHVEDRYLELPK